MGSFKKITLTSDILKLLACLFMFIDHLGYGLLRFYIQNNQYIFLPSTIDNLKKLYEIMRGVGRLAFPIFCFLLVEGFIHTKSVLKYALRLLILAIVSELIFDLTFFKSTAYLDHQNVMVTLLLGLLTIWAIDYSLKIPGLSDFLKFILVISIGASAMEIASLIKCDYNYHGILSIILLYITRTAPPVNLLVGAASFSWEKYAPSSFLLMYFYDESKKPSKKYRLFFYLFYPVHLLLIFLIAKTLNL